jgi:hypothetical protein
MDVNEQRRKRRRECYAQMTDEKKEEMLRKRREAYQQKKTIDPNQMTKRNAQERQKYADMEPKQKKARIEKVAINKVLKRNTPCKESIAMVNPAYITTDQEAGTSAINARQRRPVTPGERQKLLHCRNEEFSAKQRKAGSVSSQETSVMNSDNDGKGPQSTQRL